MPAGEIIFNDRPDLFDDPLPGSLQNYQDQNIVINLTMNVANYCCRFWKWVGCFIIEVKIMVKWTGMPVSFNGSVFLKGKYLPKKINQQ